MSTLAAILLSEVLPLDLEIKKIIGSRVICSDFAVTPSSRSQAKPLLPSGETITQQPDANKKLLLNNLRKKAWDAWGSEWESASTGKTTRRFFPYVPKYGFINLLHISPIVTQIITGHLSKVCKLPFVPLWSGGGND